MADTKTGFDELFNFSDKTPIEDAIKVIEKLESTYTKFVDSVSAQSKSLADDMGSVKEQAAAMLKTIDSLNNVATKNADAYHTVAKGVDDLADSQSTLKTQIDNNNKSLIDATTQLNNIKKAKKDLADVNKTESGSIDDLNKKLADATKAYKAMGDSTDNAIKTEQLKKIAQLSEEFKKANGAITDAKKAVEYAAGSYDALSAKVANSKKQLRAMEDGVINSTSEFEKLKAEVKADTQTLKDWDDSVGDNKRNVGDYAGKIGALIPGFSGVAGAIDTATTASKAFIATPLGLIIGLIAGAVASLTAYFKGSVEGQDKWNKVMAYAGAILDLFLDGLEAVGGYLADLGTHLKPLGDLLVDMWDKPLEYIKKFGDFLYTNVVNRFVALGEILTAVKKVVNSGFTDGFKDLGNAMLKSATGVDKLIDKTLEFAGAATDAAKKALKDLADAAAKKLAIEQALADKENLIRKEKIKDVVDDAQTELKVNELLEESKDKIEFADLDRLKKVREARKLLNDQLQGDLDLAQLEIDAQKLRIQAAGGVLQANKKLSEYTNEELKNIGVKYELLEELARLEASQINLEADAANKRKALTKQEIGIINEISAAYFDRIKREKQAQDEIDTYLAQSVMKRNADILADEDSTLAQRLDAVKSNAEEMDKITNINYEKDLDAAKEASIAKIELDSATTQAIYNDQTKSLTEQIQAEKNAKEAALMNDSKYAQERDIFIKQSDKLFAQYTDNIIANTDKAKQSGQDNIFKVLDRDFKILNSHIAEGASTAQKELDDSYAAGNISMRQFQKERVKITNESTRDRLQAELDYLTETLKQTGLTESKKAELAAKSADIQKQLSDQTANYILANEQKLRAALNDLANQGLNFITAAIKGQEQAHIDSLNTQLNAAQMSHDRSIALAGDDAQAKAIIDQNFANKKIAIERQIGAEKRKQAIADKARASAAIIIDTARAIVSALPNIPLSIAIGAVGALELATVVATPIPQFWEGTDNAPEGLAMVGERGGELGFSPSGEVTYYAKPQIAHLEKGTVIKTASESDSLIEQAKQFGDGYLYNQQQLAYDMSIDRMQEASMDADRIIGALEDQKMAIVDAVKNQPQDTWDDQGYRRFLRNGNTRIEYLNKKYSLG